MEKKKITIPALLYNLRRHQTPNIYLEEIEDKYGKDTKLELMIADFTDRLVKRGFNVNEYLLPYQGWNSFERMKLLRLRLQEIEEPVIKKVLTIVNLANQTFTQEQKIQVRLKMHQTYFANLKKDANGFYFKIDEDYYDVLCNLYYKDIPNIFL